MLAADGVGCNFIVPWLLPRLCRATMNASDILDETYGLVHRIC
jgi:hypothetical protein